MELRAKGVIGVGQGGHAVLELKSSAEADQIRSHIGEEVDLVIVTKEDPAASKATQPYWNVEDQQ
ncbi:hypothetical protein [Geomonas oryzae]|uniref:hypothetical protein n=1 Tax=Geomonas oryzae TaxID=2364273 RepID=UPI00100ADA84|nr:hypothetical protein [Geomonas oryzae]